MTAPHDHDVLGKALEGWRPPVVGNSRVVDPWQSAAFADLIDVPPPHDRDPLPPLWHWFTLLAHPASSEIGEDGHPADGPFLPPIPGRRRMIAGGRFSQWAPIPHGSTLSARSSVTDVTVKTGRTGQMAFVTTRHELSANDIAVAVEEQDVVYRSEPEGSAPRVTPRMETGEAAPTGEWACMVPADPVLLSRFSALTYNGHRIHYDRPYVTEVERYPDLVIHGPLLALLALELPRIHLTPGAVREVRYRLTRPAFVPASLVAAGTRRGDQLDVAVAAVGALPSLTAAITLA